uniref:Guanine nucleotide exchange factor DBS n=1 Tax=Anopheles funestus TaxID=62324 RepID=A0A4Y0BMZ7_ANOFN
MMHQPSRVLHQSSVALRSVSQPNGHHARSGTTGVSTASNQAADPHPSKGPHQYTKFRNNRSASSSRIVGGLQAQIKAESKADCLRKHEARTCKNGMEVESFATDRIPKMKLLKVNYVNLKNEEADKKAAPEVDKKEAVASFTVNPAKHGKILKEDVERKKTISTAAVVGCSEKSTNGGKVVTSTTNNHVVDASASAFVGKKEKKECKTTTTSREPEAKNGDPAKTGNSKYLVYKKHNGFGANSPHSTESSTAGGKLQYINDSDIKIKALAKKKYGLLFENKKKSKLETVQYYFDSRGYERYVDNKLYGVINEKKNLQDVQSAQSGPTATQAKSSDVQHKRLSWDVRQHNRPSMMRVINQSPAAKKCANVLMMNQQVASKPMSAEAPETLGGGGLKQENCRMFKLQKSHTSTNLLTRHKSMNDIHRINQLFLDSREDPDPLANVSVSSRPNSKHAGNSCDPTSPNNGVAVRDITPVHRFEKHRKSEQSKYLVHKRLSARYKTESNLPKSVDVSAPVAPDTVTSCTLSGDDTISKRIRKIIDDQDRIVSTETLDLQPDEMQTHDVDKQKQSSQNHPTHQSSAENGCAKKYRRLSKSKSADKLIVDSKHMAEMLVKKEKNGSTCGYKNCKFSNCPMSSSSSSSSASSTTSTSSCSNVKECSRKTVSSLKPTAIDSSTSDQLDIILCGKRTSIVINDSEDIMSTGKELPEYKNEKFVINNLLNNGMLSGKVNNTHSSSKDLIDDTEIITSSTIKEIDLESNRMIIEKCIAHAPPNIGIVSRQKFWNQQNQRNIKLKNNPQTKAYDDKIKINNKIKNEENNSIKIFISSGNGSNGTKCASLSEPVSLISTATTNSNRSSSRSYSSNSSWASTGSESDKDDGYYDQSERSISPEKQQPSSIVSTTSTDSSSSSTICSESTNVSNVTCTKSLPASSATTVTHNGRNRYTSKTSIRLGCDGSLFLNKNYLDEGEGLQGTVTSDLEGDDNEMSVCDVQQSIGTSSACCCCRKRHQKFAHRTQPCLVSSIDITTNSNSENPKDCEGFAMSAVKTNDIGHAHKHKSEHCSCVKQINAQNKIENFSPRPRSIEGPLDSGISISSDTAITSSDSDLNIQSQTDSDERKLKRGHVLAELLETERIYVAEMGSILKGYKDEMLSEEMSSLVPPGLQGKSDILFGNLHELYTFHNDIFLKDLENCISTTELVALCFVQRRDTFFRLYSYYCQNIPRSERLRETLVDTHLFLQECQKKLGHKLPLAAYLLKPVQRITKYQLLLKDLLKFSDTGTCSRELQKALDCMLVVLKCVNDSMHQIAITGFPADLSQQGELLMQDSFQVWTESKKDLRLRLKTQNRHIFLYQKAMLFCKQGSKTGHNKSTYQFKHWLQMSQIGLTESVRGDSKRFEVWLQGRQEVHTIQASTIEIKNKWVAEIKKVLLNQLEELKGEKIKQYGLNHKPLRHMTSWDVPQAVHGTPNRIVSCDQQAQLQTNGLAAAGMVGLAQDVVTRISNLNDDGLLNATGISSSSSEHDNQESNAWSSDYSNSEDEFTTVEDSVVPGHKFVSLADYCAMGNSEVSMKEAEVVELLKVGCAGWWFVKVISTGLEGWAPAAYLEAVSRKNSRLRNARSQDRLNEH